MNVRYPFGTQKILEGAIPWNTAPVVALLVGTNSYVYNPVHQYLADIPVADRIMMSPLLGRTSTLGVADANDTLFVSVPAGRGISAVVLLTNTGNPSTSILIAYLGDAVGLPKSSDGSNILITWNNGTNKVFAL